VLPVWASGHSGGCCGCCGCCATQWTRAVDCPLHGADPSAPEGAHQASPSSPAVLCCAVLCCAVLHKIRVTKTSGRPVSTASSLRIIPWICSQAAAMPSISYEPIETRDPDVNVADSGSSQRLGPSSSEVPPQACLHACPLTESNSRHHPVLRRLPVERFPLNAAFCVALSPVLRAGARHPRASGIAPVTPAALMPRI
jgi:hypothetical protein